MQTCAELKNLVLQNYEKVAAGKSVEVVNHSYSHQAGVTLLGTDPKEWFEGFELIKLFYSQAGGSSLEIVVEDLQAFCEGNIGWTVDRVKLILPNGIELPIRHTHIFQKEQAGWKIVHNHVSLAVPNESIGTDAYFQPKEKRKDE